MKEKWFGISLVLAFLAAIAFGITIGTVLEDLPDGQVMIAAAILSASAAAVSWMGYRTWIRPKN